MRIKNITKRDVRIDGKIIVSGEETDISDGDYINKWIANKFIIEVNEEKARCPECNGTNVHYKDGCLDCKKKTAEKKSGKKSSKKEDKKNAEDELPEDIKTMEAE